MTNLNKLFKRFILVAAIAITFTTCGENGDISSSHIHQWGEWVETIPPDCTTAGVDTRICELDASHVETRAGAAALGHDWNMISGTATCTEAGVGTAECNRCGETIIDDIIPALGHDWGEWTETTPPDCTIPGEEERVCKRDSSHTESCPVAALGHDWGAWTYMVTPTCTTPGLETRICNRCSEPDSVTRPVAALGHDWGEWTETTPPDCTTEGEEERVCNRDSSHIETHSVAALGHDPYEGYCLTCGDFLNSYIIGDTGPGGGKIFYVSLSGFSMTDTGKTAHYLEAASNDIPTLLAWSSYPAGGTHPDITGTGNGIGTGRKNTNLILAGDLNAPAAKACDEYVTGKNDWFLPSLDELDELHKQKALFNNWGTTYNLDEDEFALAYWSSSQGDDGHSWAQFFNVLTELDLNDGDQLEPTKNNKASVRPIRAF